MIEVLEPVEILSVESSASLGIWERTELTCARMLASAALGSVFSFMLTVMVEEPSWLFEVM